MCFRASATVNLILKHKRKLLKLKLPTPQAFLACESSLEVIALQRISPGGPKTIGKFEWKIRKELMNERANEKGTIKNRIHKTTE